MLIMLAHLDGVPHAHPQDITVIVLGMVLAAGCYLFLKFGKGKES